MSTPVIDADAVDRHPSAHDRRAYGYGLLAVALIAALCVPGLVGRRANGAASPAPPAPPPTVGQCAAQIDRPEDLDRLTGVPLVDCAKGTHSGEVVFVGRFADGDSYPEIPTAPALRYPKQACALKVNEYAGIPATPLALVDQAGGTAHVRPQVQSVVTVPTSHQWQSGQRWYACQVRPAGDTLPMTYAGSVAGAAWGETMPATFSRCAQVIGGAAVPCTEPHYAEQLSDFVAAGAELDCHRVGVLLTGAPDPNFHGALSITGWRASGGRNACWATSTTGQPFVGTLLGWGNRPFPGG